MKPLIERLRELSTKNKTVLEKAQRAAENQIKMANAAKAVSKEIKSGKV
jgi:hypothetical protein